MSNKYNIESTNIQTAPGVNLNEDQRTIVGSVLDLFAGRPSLEKLSLWTDDAVFEDPITQARGRKQYEPQWYGLQAAFSEIERLHHSVTSSGNPIEMDLKTRYKVKGIGMEQVIDSKVLINLDNQGKITHVQDKWDGKLPESSIQNVSQRIWENPLRAANPMLWAYYWGSWVFYAWSLVWWTTPWLVRGPAALFLPQRFPSDGQERMARMLTIQSQAFRRLNAVTVPNMVGVPKNKEEDAAKGN